MNELSMQNVLDDLLPLATLAYMGHNVMTIYHYAALHM